MPIILIAVVAVAMLLIAVFFIAVGLRRVVPTNMVHIVQSQKRTVSYGKGQAAGNVYYEVPQAIPMFGVTVTHFPVSNFDITLKNYDAYDSGRLPFAVDVMAFFRIDDSDAAAHRVSNYAELITQLTGVLQGAVRRTLAIHPLEEIMEDRTKLGLTFTQEVDPSLREWGVSSVKNIEFMDIRDFAGSTVIANIMAKEKSRIEKESRITVANNHRDAETQEIDAERTVNVQRQDAEQQVGIRTAEKDKIVGIAAQKSKQEVQMEAKITAEKDMDVRQVNEVRTAQISRSVAEVAAEKERSVLIIDSDAERQRIELVAQGNLTAAQRNATAIEVQGRAEGAAIEAKGLAGIAPQISLAKEIGTNDGYQTYLVQIKTVEANRDVGMKQAEALTAADIRVIANGGTIQEGFTGLGALLGPTGGTAIAGLLAALGQSEEGAALVERVTGEPPAPRRPRGDRPRPQA